MYDLEFAKKQVIDLDRFRTTRALSGATEEFKQVFQLISLLLHLNHPQLPGYIDDAAAGIAAFEFSDYQIAYLSQHFPDILAIEKNSDKIARSFAINGVYVMGSISSICQTSSSDLDIWVCYQDDLSGYQRHQLEQKCTALQQWAKQFDIEINLFLMDQARFRHAKYADVISQENCGSAQYMLLLDEFYRSAIRLAGKPLLWLHLAVDNEQDYETEVARLVAENRLNLQDWVDFGGLGAFSANEYFGASLWNLYKGISAPYKAVIKILLLEAYAWEYPYTKLISCEFKRHLLSNNTESQHFDAYLAMLERVTDYLLAVKDKKRLEFVRRCFYVKASEDIWYNKEPSWRFDLLKDLTKEWGWSQELVDELNVRPFWKIKRVKASYTNLIQVLMLSYRNLVNFARKNDVNFSIMPQDISILTRKLSIAFEAIPGKVTLVNPQIAEDLSEPCLTFVEVEKGRLQKGWYVINQSPKATELSPMRYVEYNPNLAKLVAWAYFNGLLTSETELHISSKHVNLEKLYNFVADLREYCPVSVPPATHEELNHPCEIRHLSVVVNLVSDPTVQMPTRKNAIQQSDLLSIGEDQECVIGSIDFIYRNLWNEIRTFHFEGANAMLMALKVLSNKIHYNTHSPKSVNVFCYSQQYCRELTQLVSELINKCITLQLGIHLDSSNNQLLRIANKNWQYFFEQNLDLVNLTDCQYCSPKLAKNPPLFVDEPTNPEQARQYPMEIDAFASEGFLQFFFEDNPDGTFNVYILDELNHIEIYHRCDGDKEQKIYEINQIYNSSDIEGKNNPYKIVQRDFNYPQFYRLLPNANGVMIVPFHSRQSF